MQTTVISKLPAQISNSCLVVGVNDNNGFATIDKLISRQAKSHLKKALSLGDLPDAIGETLLLRDIPDTATTRVLLVRVGSFKAIGAESFQKICMSATAAILRTGTKTVVSLLNHLKVKGRDNTWQCAQESFIVHNSSYSFRGHTVGGQSEKGNPKMKTAATKSLLKWCLLVSEKSAMRQASVVARNAASISLGCTFAKNLGNLAPNICTPTYLAKEARALARGRAKLKVSVLEEAAMKKLGMGALLSVSRGSRQPAKLICMEYTGSTKSSPPVVFLGKGVTFDTGGISIKPSAAMDEMKYDMCGAASVMGVMKACVEMDIKCNIVCIVAAAENMPDGDASRPGDVVKSMSGQTIEILNTDAEGRLVMCDALTYIKKYKPAAVIDVATLTGACIVALGHVTSALMSNDQPLADRLLEAGRLSGDKAWQLPLWEEYQTQLDSNFADVANIGGSPAGSITAGCFLARFAKDYSWAHLDVAGTAWVSGKNKGATGRPVPLLMQYLLDHHV